MSAISAAHVQVAAGGSARSDRLASLASLRRRLESATDENKRLRKRVAELEARLATLYGELRLRQAPSTDLRR
jgi:chromosome segregation ATPase